MSPSRVGTCLLCLTETFITKEDVVATWVRRTMMRMFPEGEQAPPRYTMPLCRPCNGRLGAEFQEWASWFARPMLLGAPTELDADDQQRLSAWIMMTDLELAMARKLHFSFGHPPREMTPEFREPYRLLLKRLLVDKAPPAHVSIRIGMWGSTSTPIDPTPFLPSVIDPFSWFLTSITPVGYLLTESVIGRSAPIDSLITATALDDRMVRIWPIRNDIVQVPQRPIHPSDGVRLAREWGHSPDNHVGGGFQVRVPRRS